MRILIVTNTYTPALNGQAVFSTHLAEGLAAENHQVRVLLPAADRMPFEIRNNVQIQAIQALDLRFIHNDLSLAWASPHHADRILDEFRPDIVHLQDPAPLSRAMMAAAHRSGIPVIATHHPGPAVWAPYLRGDTWLVQKIIVPIIWRYFIAYLNHMDSVVTPSQASADMLHMHKLKSPIYPLTCGVPAAAFKASIGTQSQLRQQFHLPLEDKLFLYIGRLDAEKRVDVLIRALGEAHDTHIQIVIAGAGSQESSLHSLVEALHLRDRVHFLGNIQQPDIAALLAACDVFVMPGDGESLSIATLEAMAAHKVVIAANAMALPELVHHGENGYLFAPGDPADLGRKMDRLSAQPQAWATMGTKGYQRAQHHQLKKTIAGYERIYHTQINQKAQRKPKTWQLPLPRTLINPNFLAILVQFAALIVILALSLFYNHHAVVAAPTPDVDLISPQMLAEIKNLLLSLKQIELPGKQAGALGMALQVARDFSSNPLGIFA